ncbi:MAG: hypothetical protein MJ186_06475 [Clostridia bacterium]|nr:hypothetical protein [Clostridia bacterium]
MTSTQKKELKKEKSYKLQVFTALILVCVLFLCNIGITAYSSTLQYEINSMENQMASMKKDVQNLQIKIKQSANITNLEARAEELGLIYPDFSQIVYLQADSGNIEDFALALIESAYN